MSYALALKETWALSLCVMLVNMFVLLFRVFSLERDSDTKFSDQFMFVTDFLHKFSFVAENKWNFNGEQPENDKSEIIEWLYFKKLMLR